MPKKVADYMGSDQEEDAGRSKSVRRAPKGHFVVYVGSDMKRFVVPTSFLKNHMFQELLDKSAEEFGFGDAHSRIVLPCDESAFRNLVAFLAKR